MSAVLFDLDGTLTDSEPLSRAAWSAALADHGYRMTAEDAASMSGRGFSEVYGYFAARAELPGEEAIWRAHSDRLFPSLDADLRVFEDAAEVVAELVRRGVPRAVVSASRRPRVERTLRAAGLLDCFDVLVCGEDVERPKPAPDGYLAAARALDVAPERCVVVEDSRLGAQAGVAAGARVIRLWREGAPSPCVAHASTRRLSTELVLDELERAAP